MSRFKAGVVAVTLVLLAVVLTAPAALLQRHLPPQLGVSGMDGTLWHGQLHNPQWQGQDLVDELGWDWHPLALLWLTLDIDFTTRRGDHTGHVAFASGLFGVLFHDWHRGLPAFRVSDVNLELPLAPLAAAAPPVADYRLQGDVAVHSSNFSWSENGGKGELDVDWNNARSELSGDALMGSYTATIKAGERGYLIRLSTVSGALQLKGDGNGSPEDGWHGGVSVLAPDNQFATFQSLLAHFGPPGPDGLYRLRYSFKGDPHVPVHF